jgi:hypothetical protein
MLEGNITQAGTPAGCVSEVTGTYEGDPKAF